MEWLNLGSVHTSQGHKVPAEAPVEFHCTGASEASTGLVDTSWHFAAADDDVEEEEEEEEEGDVRVRRGSWVRRM